MENTIDLFAPFNLKGLLLRNRFVRSATWDATADETGAVTAHSVAIYRSLAAGHIGLIVTGYAFVSRSGQAVHGQFGVYSDEMVGGLHRLVEVVHSAGGKIALQIVHSGLNSPYLARQGTVALAPSQVERSSTRHREMTETEIENIIADFAAAATRAKRAGFDAVQFHGAHGYLTSQFLSPLYNLRRDRWGGSPEGRLRFPLEAVRAVRRAVGADYPVLIKLGVADDADGGLSLNEGVEAACALVEAGVDALEVSTGFGSSRRGGSDKAPLEGPYYRDWAAAVKGRVKVPVITVGGIRSLEQAEDIVSSGDADLVSMCRPFIREPGLIARWRRGERTAARCLTCNKCRTIVARGEPLQCGEELRLQVEAASR